MVYKIIGTKDVVSITSHGGDGKRNKFSVFVLPYEIVEGGKVKVYMTLKNEDVNPMLFFLNEEPFKDNITELMKTTMFNSTLGTFNFKREYIKENTYYMMDIDDGINPVIFAFFNIRNVDTTKKNFFISRYVRKFSETLQKSELGSYSDLSETLIYLSPDQLYVLCSAVYDEEASYEIADDDGDSHPFEVSNGMLVDSEISDLYNVKGKINLNEVNRSIANYPPRTAIVRSINESFAIQCIRDLKKADSDDLFVDLSRKDIN